MLSKSSCVSTTITQWKNQDNELIADDFEKAGLLNTHFCSTSTLNDSHSEIPKFPERTDKKNIINVTPDQVKDILQILKMGKASGDDSIMLKKTCHTVSVPLERLFNLSLIKSEFPSQWKIAFWIYSKMIKWWQIIGQYH